MDQLYLAPLQGLTDNVFRNTWDKFFKGFDGAYTPYFATSPSAKYRKNLLKKKIDEKSTSLKIIPQILSKSAKETIQICQSFEDLGFNIVNLNMGCPYPRVHKKKRGSGLLPHPEYVNEYLGEVLNNINLKFSIKVRLGLEDQNEIDKLIPIFNRYDLYEVIIHPRTASQLYGGEVILSKFKEIYQDFKATVMYNGDINTVNNFQSLKEEFPDINSFMIGRGVLANPFLPSIIKGKDLPSIEIQKEIVQNYIHALYEGFCSRKKNPESFPSVMKEFWSYLCLSFNEPQEIFNQIKLVKSRSEYEELTIKIFENYDWDPK
jgi:tRNA-dihydrouridine synthase